MFESLQDMLGMDRPNYEVFERGQSKSRSEISDTGVSTPQPFKPLDPAYIPSKTKFLSLTLKPPQIHRQPLKHKP